MEGSIFPKPEVNELLSQFVEIRMHVDAAQNPEAEERAKRYKKYGISLTRSSGIPSYVIIDPNQPNVPAGVFRGLDLSGGAKFAKFLKDYLATI